MSEGMSRMARAHRAVVLKRHAAASLIASLVMTTAFTGARADGSANDLYRKAKAAIDRGDCVSALPLLLEGLRIAPTAAAYVHAGHCHRKLGDLEKAARAYETAATQYQGALARYAKELHDLVEVELSSRRDPDESSPRIPPSIEKVAREPPKDRAPDKVSHVIEPATRWVQREESANQSTRALAWTGAAATGAALIAGAGFGLKTMSSRLPSDARKANVLYGAGGALAAVTVALFVVSF